MTYKCDGCGKDMAFQYDDFSFDARREISYGEQSDYYCEECWPKIKDAALRFDNAWREIQAAVWNTFREKK